MKFYTNITEMEILKTFYLPISCKICVSLHEEMAHVAVVVCPHGSLKAWPHWEELCQLMI